MTSPLPTVGFVAGELSGDNGWARLALETVRELARLGIRPRVLYNRNGRALEDPHLDATPLLPLWPQHPARWPFSVAAAAPRVVRALGDCELIHCLVEPYAPLASLAGSWLGKPLVATAVGTYSALPARPFSGFFFWTRRARAIVCISRYTEKRVRRIRPDAPTVVINPGVDTKTFSPAEAGGRPAGVGGRVILSVGAVKPRKGYHVAVRALALLPPALEDAALYIAGDRTTHPGYVESVLSLARELRVTDRVHLLGHVEGGELVDWYRRADVFLLNATSWGDHFEGFGLSLLEAGACGKPVIGCRDSGAEDIILPGENGLLIPQDDPGETAKAIREILSGPAVSREMGRRGLARAREMSWESSARRLMDLYQRIAATG
jgi:glycosyltransferase involved in cell wall biosynthesis